MSCLNRLGQCDRHINGCNTFLGLPHPVYLEFLLLLGESVIECLYRLLGVWIQAGRNSLVVACPYITVGVGDAEAVACGIVRHCLEIEITGCNVVYRRTCRGADGCRIFRTIERQTCVVWIRHILHVWVILLVLVFLAFAVQDDFASSVSVGTKTIRIHIRIASVWRNIVVAGVILADFLLDPCDIDYLFLFCHVFTFHIVQGILNQVVKLLFLVFLIRYLILIFLGKQLGLIRIIAIVAICYIVDAEVDDTIIRVEAYIGKPYRLVGVIAAVDGPHRTVFAEDVEINLLQYIRVVVGEVEGEQYIAWRVIPRL